MRRITRFFAWALGIVLGVAALLFAIESRETVTLALWGIPDRLEVSLFTAVLGFWVIGFFCGAIVMWFCHGDSRRLGRAYQMEAAETRRENDKLKRDLAAMREAADAADLARAPALGPANSNRQQTLLPGRTG
ncbi:MAG: hypothetical protein KDC18_19250 [Alphaproteobacteria bacterium]|nr:hypothetical protein [Alphaproteobacteria bacterium]MCB9931586.1 hypothetical protein [Alphaproteobacteria bacterium]